MRQIRFGKRSHNYIHPQKPRYASTDGHRHKKLFDGRLKVVTYNIKLSRQITKAIDVLDGHEDLKDADIICLQEMAPDGVDAIARALKYNYIYYPAILHPRINKDFGNAILAKGRIVEDHKIILPEIGRGHLQRIAVCATVEIHKYRVLVICLHMKVLAKGQQRRIPIDHIIGSIDPRVRHCIVAGDFNTFTKSACKLVFDPFREAGFHLVTDSVGLTYNYWYLFNRKAALDHIFSKGLKVVRAGKVHRPKASDHIPIWGELKIEK